MRWLLFPAKISAWLLQALPWRLQWGFAWALGIFWFDILRIRRRVVIDNVGIAFPHLSKRERVRLGRLGMVSFCMSLVEYARLPFLKASTLNQIDFEGLEYLEDALQKKKGVLLLSLHLGNGDLGSAALALKGFPIHLVSKVFKTKWLNDAWFGMRERVGVRFIPPRHSSYGILKALKKNEIVIFVMDQFTGPPIGIRSTFFGRETGTGLGLALMAERSKAPVIPAFTLRSPQGRLKVICKPEIQFEMVGDHDQSLARMTQVYNDHLESYVRICPEQWMWLHKRWKKFKV